MALVVGCVLLTVFSVPAMMVFFRLYAGTEKFSGTDQRKPGDLKGKMAQGGLTAVSSIKPVSDPGAGPYITGQLW